MPAPGIKICGLTTPETVDAALRAGASHIGLVFFARSPRNVEIGLAARLAAQARGAAKVVGLFVDPPRDLLDAVRAQVTLDVIQLHGAETPAVAARIGMHHGLEVWKAVPVRRGEDLAMARKYVGSVARVLYDAKAPTGDGLPGGNGLRFDWNLLAGYRHALPWVLAGGLDPRNVGEAVRVTGADLLDVSSGVESAPGVKDVDLIAAFCQAARQS
jgi:phosphoribosylanthranilate isomerase